MNINSHESDPERLVTPKRVFTRLFPLLYKLLYHQLAWSYDFVAWLVSAGSWNKWIHAVTPLVKGPRVLEIGFGPGHLQLSLQQKHLEVFGLDESTQMGRAARKRLLNAGFQPALVRGDAQAMPFADESFSQVVLTFPAEFILKPTTILEIRRVLTRDGLAVMLPLAWITGKNPMERLVAWVNRVSGETPLWNPKILDPLKEAGFEVGWEEVDFPNSKVVIIRMQKV